MDAALVEYVEGAGATDALVVGAVYEGVVVTGAPVLGATGVVAAGTGAEEVAVGDE